VDPRSNVVKLIQAAQTEVVVSGEPGLYRADAPDSQAAEQLTRNPQQERLAREGGSSAVYSVPLRKEKDLVAVWTFEFTETPLTEDLRQVIDVMAGQASPILELARQNDMGPLARTGRSAAKAAKWLFGKEHPWRKVAMAAAIGLAAVAVFGKIDFNVTASCRLEPSFKRIYAAPFNTTIKAAPVRPGDTVSAGQTVVQLDREEVELQLREAQSKRTSAEKEKSTYLAQQKIPQWAEAEARHEALGAEIELLQRHLAKTTIKALDAGIVISGDLRQDIDRQVRMGEQLMEIAPLSELVLEVELDQGDVSYIQPGQSGRFTTKARPSVSTDFAVTKIHPTPEARSGASVYVAEATVANPADAAYANADDPSSANAAGWLRPGMEGAAKIKVDRRNVTWVLTRKLINWLRLRLWW
jgi:hypothetical protein